MSSRFALWVGLLAAVGCTKPSPNPPIPEPPVKTAVDITPPRTGVGADTTPSHAAPAVDPAAFAKDFLKAVHEGSATAAGLTPAFKTVIAPPAFDADAARGYSDAVADSWLKQYQGKLTAPSVYPFGGDANTQLFTAFLPGEKPRHVALRLTKADGGWLADWFFPAEVEPTVPKSGDAAAFAAVAFLDALLSGHGHVAAGLMAADAKARLAPPFGGQKQPYNAGILDQKLATYRGSFTSFSVAKAEGGTVAGELTGGPAAKKPFTLRLAAGGRPGEWLVDDVKID